MIGNDLKWSEIIQNDLKMMKKRISWATITNDDDDGDESDKHI